MKIKYWLNHSEYARKHGVSRQLIRYRIIIGAIPQNEFGYINSDFPFVKRLKSGRKTESKQK